MYYVDKRIQDLYRIFDQNERSGFLRLDLNENPGGLPEDFVKKVLSDVTPGFVSQYPETRHFSEVLAKHLNTNPENICLVNGSAEGIRYVIQAFTSENGRIVGVTPSYFMFQVYSEMYNRKFIKVPYDSDLNMSVDRIISELSPDTQLLILLNPNNPMGNAYSKEEIERMLNAAKENEITVLIDEAYYYFHPTSFINYAIEGQNIFVTRTFSKLFSMAGCRLGYVVGWKEGIKCVQNLCTPHNVNAFSLKFAEEILETPGMIDMLIANFNEGRDYLVKELDRLGYEHKGEAGNFIFIKPQSNAEKIVSMMKDQKRILIKSYPDVGSMGDCLRVSIGEKKYMEQFVKALIEIDK